MTRQDAFLKAICDNPANDGLRLIYSDWLTKRGDPLGAFIRMQVEIAHLAVGEPRYKDVKRQELRLWVDHRDEWRQPFLELGAEAIEFDRGLPTEVRISAKEFLENQDRLFALAPIRRLELTNVSREQAIDIAKSHHLQRVTHLTLDTTNVGDEGIIALAGSDHLKNLVGLNLRHNQITALGAKVVAESVNFQGLTHLDLSENPLGDAGVAAIAGSPHLLGLTYLNLVKSDLGDDGAQIIAASPNVNRLTELALGCNRITDLGTQALACSPYLGNVISLDLGENPISESGARMIAESPKLARLAALDVLTPDVGDAVLGEIRRKLAKRQQSNQREP